jgi:hypothetical protein
MYVVGNPMKYVDPTGLFWEELFNSIKTWVSEKLQSMGPEVEPKPMQGVDELAGEVGLSETQQEHFDETNVERKGQGALIEGTSAVVAATTATAVVVGTAVGAQRAARAVDPNKLRHVFGASRHRLGPLIEVFGSEESAFLAVESAAQAAVRAQQLSGVFEVTVSIGQQNVVVRGAVVEGVARIGTFFIP